MMEFSGGCLCGAVRYEGSEQKGGGHCHCIDCRKSSGTGHSSHMVVPEDSFRATGEVTCQRRSKISPPGRSKTSPLNVMRYAVLGGSCGPTGSTIAPAVKQVFLGIPAVFGFG